uniref:Coenzyme Q-binding protein COQ10 START domain-containing protein n=1 Tax=Chenopodium quinoa TaxID=63459 RepID=A0A803L5T7_CHEQI
MVKVNDYVEIINVIEHVFGSIAGIDSFSSRNVIHPSRNSFNSYDKLQRRWFLGCGDGQEGNALSKMYEEKLVIGKLTSKTEAFPIIAVDLYDDILPWCQRSEIVRRNPDGSFDAELEIGFRFLVESYISHVVLDKPKFISFAVWTRLDLGGGGERMVMAGFEYEFLDGFGGLVCGGLVVGGSGGGED